MADDADRTNGSGLEQPDAEHYRKAAEAALDQLDWCVGYLHRIRRSALADALARNRSEIQRRLA